MVCRQLMVRGIVVMSILVGRSEMIAGSDDSKLAIDPESSINIGTAVAPVSMMLVRAGIK